MSFSIYHSSIAIAALLLSTLITSSPIPQTVPATSADATSDTTTQNYADSFTVGTGSTALTVTVSTNSSAVLTYSNINATITSFESKFRGFNPLATLSTPTNTTYGGTAAGIAPVFYLSSSTSTTPTPYQQSTEIGYRDVLLVLDGLRDWMHGKNLTSEVDFTVSRAGTTAGTTVTEAGEEVAGGFMRDDALNGTTAALVNVGGKQMTCSPVTSG
ncbi:MAG: hypothetical protein OHK93_003046 [Ramalina farinacea]|uniref:Uncharacterized protein n=1 Tax=Ramalina farinacea TaxID=258253 RepID=A0AA43TZE1_9LECA|nr:hypothetical protein [Ramalina farinacea]